MGKIIAVCNQKGGVGKTTTAINLAACLAAAEHKTLLVDIDPQCNATTGLGIDKNEPDYSVYDLIAWSDSDEDEEKNVAEIVVHSPKIDFLDILPSSPDLAGAQIELVNVIAREKRLSRTLRPAAEHYNYVIVDSPPALGVLTVNVLTAADSVLIPIQCEYYALEGLAELLSTIRLVQKTLNPSLAIEGALLTMYDGRLNLSRQVAEDVRSYFSGRIFQTAIPRNVKLSEPPSYGIPIILYDIMSSGAEGYLKLAKEIMDNG